MKCYVRSKQEAEAVCKAIMDKPIGEHGYSVEILLGTRTLPQNNAMHQYFTDLSNALNDAGYEIELNFLHKEKLMHPWDAAKVKELIWRPAQEAITGKTSTTRLDRNEVSAVYEALARFFSTRFELYIPFPSFWNE